MNLSVEELTTAQAGRPVKIYSNGQTFYLLSEHIYEELTQPDFGSMTKEEMNLLTDEADQLISQNETDEY